jgi:hypothetical protein
VGAPVVSVVSGTVAVVVGTVAVVPVTGTVDMGTVAVTAGPDCADAVARDETSIETATPVIARAMPIA